MDWSRQRDDYGLELAKRRIMGWRSPKGRLLVGRRKRIIMG